MKKSSSRITRRWIVSIAIVILAIATISVTYAAYTNYSYMKGVAVSKMASIPFSSNYLVLEEGAIGDTEMETVIVPVKTDENEQVTSYSLVYQVRNYSNSNPSEPSLEDINYLIEFVIKPKEGQELAMSGYKLDGNPMTKVGEFYSGKTKANLQGGQLELNEHQLTIPILDLKNIEIYAKAIPDPESLLVTNQQILAAKVVITEYSDELESNANWIGKLVDMDLEGTEASQRYAALNYEITGTGIQQISLQWDATKFELDPYFVNEILQGGDEAEIKGSLNISGETATLTLDVDSNIKEYYLIQFYRKQPIESTETWKQLAEVFQFKVNT